MTAKFSVIVPLFDTAEDDLIKRLKKCLDMISGQTIGAGAVQLIMAGPAAYEEKSGKTAAKYGFASRGYVSGEYVTDALLRAAGMLEGELMLVCDPETKWEENAFKEVYEYFHNAPEWFDVLTVRAFPCKKIPKELAFNYLYRRGTRVTDIYSERDCLITDLTTTVIKSSAVRDCIPDSDIEYNFDAYLITSVLMNNPKAGVLNKELVTRKNARHDGYKREYSDEAERIAAIRRYHEKLLSYRTEFTNEYINYIILYDMRSYILDSGNRVIFSSEGRRLLMEHIQNVFSRLEDYNINKVPELTDAQRWGLMLLENGQDLSAEKLLSYKSPFRKKKPLHYDIKSPYTIHQIRIEDGNAVFDGMSPAFLTGAKVEIYAKTQDGKTYKSQTEPYDKISISNCFGDIVSRGKRIIIEVPVKKRTTIRFILQVNGSTRIIKPEYGPDVGLKYDWCNSFCYKGNYILSIQNGSRLSVRENETRRRLVSEWNLRKEAARRGGMKTLKARNKKIKLGRLFYSGNVTRRVAFASARSNEGLMDNMQMVWDKFSENKIAFTRQTPYPEDVLKEVAKTVYRSKVVVTDDYFFPLRRYPKRPDQYVIQIWHAPGAFKKFGVEGTAMFPGTDAMYHRDYDLVSVSSEYVRDIYARAFQIDPARVKALGMPRTDRWYDKDYLAARKASVYEKMPELKGKKVILYAPTFRDLDDKKNRIYIPEIDYSKINDALSEDRIMVLRPHPLMPSYEGVWDYDKIRLVQDISSNDMMLVSDLMVTDYSSVIFEYSLLDKPMVFLCYDYDDYDRDFYLDYEKDLPGEIFRTAEELADYIRKGDFSCSPELAAFREKYMSACDGHSSERVAKAITEYLNK